MYTLPLSVVAHWDILGDWWVPQAVDFICPHCERRVAFALRSWQFDAHRKTYATTADCPGCRESVRFWVIDPASIVESGSPRCQELCMHPTPRLQRMSMGAIDKVPEPVARAYLSALNVFSIREWDGTALL